MLSRPEAVTVDSFGWLIDSRTVKTAIFGVPTTGLLDAGSFAEAIAAFWKSCSSSIAGTGVGGSVTQILVFPHLFGANINQPNQEISTK
jgi:hypothetical protein